MSIRDILFDYQAEAAEGARDHIRHGARNILLVSPTGSGKTVIGSHLLEEATAKARPSSFVVDRISLIDQTSRTLDKYGIEHGIIQADHWRNRPEALVQVCSIQTVARRGWPASDLILIDEAHAITKTVSDRITARQTVALGLTATPFTKGLGRLYDAVVNVTTTNELIERGYLVPYRIFSCVEPDMEGVSVDSDGEFNQSQAQERALQVVGDVVQEYLARGEGRKFICSAVDTAHVMELQRQFLAAGINAATYTYKDRKDDRFDTVEEFRKTDSSIRGLITVTAASKGFDVQDISCVIMARPLRKSLAEHIQFLGRGIRTSEETGKTDCLILDHSGNCARFWKEMNEFFERGTIDLDKKKRNDPMAPEDEKEEPEPMKCPACGHMHRPRSTRPACGHEYPKRGAIEHVPGTLKEIVATGNERLMVKELWPQVVAYVMRKPGDAETHQRRAQAIYRDLTGSFARAKVEFTTPITPTPEVANKILSLQIRRAYRKKKAA